MLELGRVSRSSFYRFEPDGKPGVDGDMELRDAMQRIALEWPSYGRPRITAELRRQGWTVNPKRVYRLMREDNLLCLRRRKFVITTDSAHGLPVYPNRARELVLTGLDQLWVADITYLRLEWEFVSMSRRSNPYDNATCESFMKTLKYEEVYRTEYRGLAEARASIGI
jgi:putative transposase